MSNKENTKLVKKVKLNTVILDMNDEEVVNFDIKKDEKGVPVIQQDMTFATVVKGKKTVKDCILAALNAGYKGDEPTPEKLLKRGQAIMAVKNYNEETDGLIPEVVDTIKEVLGKGALQPLEYIQVYQLLF